MQHRAAQQTQKDRIIHLTSTQHCAYLLLLALPPQEFYCGPGRGMVLMLPESGMRGCQRAGKFTPSPTMGRSGTPTRGMT
jgi:hypothetical protein